MVLGTLPCACGCLIGAFLGLLVILGCSSVYFKFSPLKHVVLLDEGVISSIA